MGKVGRPRMFTSEVEARHRRIMDRRHETLRTVQNQLYSGVALGVLVGTGGVNVSPESKARWAWFFDEGRDRNSILSQLGRAKNPEAIKVFADRLCKLKPTAREAIPLIRRWREWFSSLLAVAIVNDEPLDDAAVARLARMAIRRAASEGWH